MNTSDFHFRLKYDRATNVPRQKTKQLTSRQFKTVDLFYENQ